MRASSFQATPACASVVRGPCVVRTEILGMKALPPSAGVVALDAVVFVIGVAILGAVLVYFARRIFKEE